MTVKARGFPRAAALGSLGVFDHRQVGDGQLLFGHDPRDGPKGEGRQAQAGGAAGCPHLVFLRDGLAHLGLPGPAPLGFGLGAPEEWDEAIKRGVRGVIRAPFVTRKPCASPGPEGAIEFIGLRDLRFRHLG